MIIAGSGALLAGLVFAVYSMLSRPAPVPMERYVPADALAFIEIDSLTDIVNGLTGTRAWRELSPLLGVSSQWRQIGSAAALIGTTGIGPDEAVLFGRAQCALVVTGLDAETAQSDEGPYVHLRPRVALVLETHLDADRASKLVNQRASIIAARLFGDGVTQSTLNYGGTALLQFNGGDASKTLVAGSKGSVIVLANGEDPIKRCLDVVGGSSTSLASDSNLANTKKQLGDDSAAFAFVTRAGLQKLVGLAPAVFGKSTSEESAGAAVNLLEHLSDQAADGLYYSARFVDGAVTERYLWALRQPVAQGLTEAFPPPSDRSFESLKLIPSDVAELTLISAENEGELPERLLKQLAPRVDVVLAVAIRELVISLKKEYGLQPSESLGDAIGNEAALVDFDDGNAKAMLLRVTDQSRLGGPVANYLSQKGASVNTSEHNGVQISVSSSDENRAAAFVGGFLVLGTSDQIAKIIDVAGGAPSLAGDGKLKTALSSAPANATLISCRFSGVEAADFMLAVSKALRVTDGSREILERQPVREAVERLPRTESVTVFRDAGVYTETRSAVGNLKRLAALFGS